MTDTHPRSGTYSRDDEELLAAWMSSRMTVAEALKRSWVLVVLPAILLGAAGVALAMSRPITYTSEARLSVGKPDPSSATFGGFVTATAGLAAIYSRSIGASGVVTPVSRALRMPKDEVQARLTATPVQDSPIIRVIGTAPSAANAQAIANAGAGALTTYTVDSNRTNVDSKRLATLYHGLALQKSINDTAVDRVERGIKLTPSKDKSARRKLQHRLERSQAWGRTLALRIDATGKAYTSSAQSQAATEVLFPLSRAATATGDRHSKVQTLGGAGVLAGLVLGVGLAMWRASRGMAAYRRRVTSAQ